MRRNLIEWNFVFIIFGALIFTGLTLAGWVTHLYICFTTGAWGFLIAGAIFFPLGVAHGWGHWFGAW